MQILLTTTGTASPVVIPDLNSITFTHPTTDYNLLEEFTLEELYDSSDLISAVTAGTITLIDDQMQVILSNYQLSPVSDISIKRSETDQLMFMGG